MRSAERASITARAGAAALAAAVLLLAGCAAPRPAKGPVPPLTPEEPVRAKLRTPNEFIKPDEPAPAGLAGTQPAPRTAPAPAPAAAAQAPTPAPAAPQVVEAPVPPEAQRAFDAARAALAAGRKAEAERGLRQLAQAHPELAGPHAALSLMLRNDNKLDEAIAAFERAVAANARRADLLNQLGVTLRMAGRFEQARAAYDRAINVDERYAPAQLNLGILLDIYLNEPAAALAQYEKYMALAGSDDNVRKWIVDLKNRVPGQSAVARKEAQ